MEIKDQFLYDAWFRSANRFEDPEQGRAILKLAEGWANALESQLRNRERLDSIAFDSFNRIMQGNVIIDDSWGHLMVEFLEECWKYGAALRIWYDKFLRA